MRQKPLDLALYKKCQFHTLTFSYSKHSAEVLQTSWYKQMCITDNSLPQNIPFYVFPLKKQNLIVFQPP